MQTISQAKYLELAKEYDVVLPPVEVQPVALAGDQVTDWGHAYLKAQAIYGQTRGERGLIFIMDTGIAPHDDLDANRAAELDADYTTDPPKSVLHPHGTHCAGIAAAVDNSKGVIGVAPGAKLVSVKVLNDSGAGQYSWIAQGIRYVADLQLTGQYAGMKKIISMSLGGPSPSTELENALNYAISKGCFLVAAAGNSGYTPGQDTTSYPGRYEQVITVAAISKDSDQDPANNPVAGYSGAGDSVDVAAPGTGVLSTVLNNAYGVFSGTSMAAPQVTGIAALLLSIKDIRTQAELEMFLEQFAIDLWEKGEDVRTGKGGPVVTQYMDQKPDPDPNPDPDPDPGPDPDPNPDPPRPERDLIFPLKQVYHTVWNRPGEKQQKVKVEITPSMKSRAPFEKAWDEMAARTEEFFRNRGFVLLPDSDLRDAGYWIAYFFDLVHKLSGVNVDVEEIRVTDQANRTCQLSGMDLKRLLGFAANYHAVFVKANSINRPYTFKGKKRLFVIN